MVSLATINKPPGRAIEIADKVVHYGRFLEGLEFMIDLFKSNRTTSMIIRGNVGVGKKTLIKEARLFCDNHVTVIYLDPFKYTDDYSAMRRIALQLGLKIKPSLTEILEDIELRVDTSDKKIVIVLFYFEEFCRQKQSLLYSFTNLTQHGDKIMLIGLTTSLDVTENLEKRVRSRLNTLFYDLKPPYRNKEEYVEFASTLLGHHKITGKLKESLHRMYVRGNRSITPLKRYLISLCSWDEKGHLTVNQPITEEPLVEPLNDSHSLTERFKCLTRSQQELVKVAVSYCFREDTLEFKLDDLLAFARRHNHYTFEIKSGLAIKNTYFVAGMGFFKPLKDGKMISQNSVFTIRAAPTQFKQMLEENPDFHSIKTDPLWKRLH